MYKQIVGLLLCFIGGGIVGAVTKNIWVSVLGVLIAQIGMVLLKT